MTAPIQNKLKVATAFSGGFGSPIFALKYENIKHQEIFAVELMKPQRECYIKNHGNPTDGIYEDISKFNGTKYKGEIDLYHLSPSCKSFSLAGKREGINCDDGRLMYHAVRSIGEVLPKVFVIENVPPLLTMDNSEIIKDILRRLSKFGYRITMDLLNAKDMGGIQNRNRLFILGERID